MGELAQPTPRPRWAISKYEVHLILLIVGVTMLAVSGESPSYGAVVGGSVGGAIGRMLGKPDDDAAQKPGLRAGLELALLTGGLIAFVLAVDAGWIMSMGEAGSMFLGPSIAALAVAGGKRVVGWD